MAVTVKLKYLRISSRKVRLAADLIRGQKVLEAETRLEFLRKKAAEPLRKLLKSGMATAENDFHLEKSNLYISKITVDEGPTLKRQRSRARGRTSPIRRRSSHITMVLKEIQPGKKIKKAKIIEKPKKEPKDIKKTKRAFKPKASVFQPKQTGALKRIFRRKAF